MAFPTYAAEDGSGLNANQTTWSLDGTDLLPVGAGDLLLAVFSCDGTPTITLPAGWTALDEQNIGGVQKAILFYRIADGTETAALGDITLSASEKAAYEIFRFTGWDGTASGIETAVLNSSGTNADPPSLTPSWGSADTKWVAAVGWDARPAISGYPASYLNGTSRLANANDGARVAMAHRDNATATEDPGAFTSGANGYAVWTVAIKPAGLGGAVDVDHPVTPLTASLGTVSPSVLTGANHSVSPMALGASLPAYTVVTGVNHDITPLQLNLASTPVTVALGANVDVALQALGLLQTTTLVVEGGDIAFVVPVQLLTLAQTAADLATGANVSVDLQVLTGSTVAPTVLTGVDLQIAVQQLGMVTVPPALTAGAQVSVPVQLLTVTQLETLTDTSSVLVSVGPLVLELSVNNNQPVAMFLTRDHNGIFVVERYRFPLG